jgi:hypothetical protein
MGTCETASSTATSELLTGRIALSDFSSDEGANLHVYLGSGTDESSCDRGQRTWHYQFR